MQQYIPYIKLDYPYRTSFNGVERRVFGVYKLYGLTELEVEIFRRENHNMINGSDGSYTIYKDSRRYIYVNMYVHSLRLPIQIDIMPQLLALTGLSRISSKLIQGLNDTFPKNIYVYYNGKKWMFDNSNLLEEVVRKCGY